MFQSRRALPLGFLRPSAALGPPVRAGIRSPTSRLDQPCGQQHPLAPFVLDRNPVASATGMPLPNGVANPKRAECRGSNGRSDERWGSSGGMGVRVSGVR